MAITGQPRVRRSLAELQHQYANGNKKPLEDVMRAWKGIKELPPADPRSFFSLGGYHGEPFRGAGWGFGNNTFWGGYCNHGNVLFPTWHRVYLFKLEEAMRSIAGCETVTLPYWDETDSASLAGGIPWALTVETVELDGKPVPNPLRSFVFPITITDNVSTDDGLYTKASGYETVRFPFSGLVGTDAAKKASQQHNSQWTAAQGVQLLNQNVVNWLTLATVNIPPDGTNPSGPIPAAVHQQFIDCLNAPNYTVFSNTTSMQQWNELHDAAVVALESAAQQHPSRGGRIRRDNGRRPGRRRVADRRRQRRHGRERHGGARSHLLLSSREHRPDVLAVATEMGQDRRARHHRRLSRHQFERQPGSDSRRTAEHLVDSRDAVEPVFQSRRRTRKGLHVALGNGLRRPRRSAAAA